MRVVGGIYRGRKLNEFKGKNIRPTLDMVRESLFNILQFRIQGKSFLDLFCGTGAVGIEAKSRGASRVVLNDVDRESVKLAKNNVESLNADIEVVNYDALNFIKNCTEKFDYIFIDAPYRDGVGIKALKDSVKILADGGEIIYENEKPYDDETEGLIKTDERKYGRAYLSFYKKSINCVFAGTFDPITKGHEEIIRECIKRYGKTYVVIGENPEKKTALTLSERFDLVATAFKGDKNVEIIKYADVKDNYEEFLKEKAKYYVRGIRNQADKEYEERYEKINLELYPFIKTVFIESGEEYKNISSSVVRLAIERGEDTSEFLSKGVNKKLKEILEKNNR